MQFADLYKQLAELYQVYSAMSFAQLYAMAYDRALG